VTILIGTSGFCCVDQPRFKSLVPPVAVVYVNDHWQDQATGTARQLRMLMETEED